MNNTNTIDHVSRVCYMLPCQCPILPDAWTSNKVIITGVVLFIIMRILVVNSTSLVV